MKTETNCFCCGVCHLDRTVRTHTFRYHGQTLVIENMIVLSCANCLENFMDEKQMEEEIEPKLREWHSKIDALAWEIQ